MTNKKPKCGCRVSSELVGHLEDGRQVFRCVSCGICVLGNMRPSNRETAALMWAAGALEEYKEGKSDATKRQARASIEVLRGFYLPRLIHMANKKEGLE